MKPMQNTEFYGKKILSLTEVRLSRLITTVGASEGATLNGDCDGNDSGWVCKSTGDDSSSAPS